MLANSSQIHWAFSENYEFERLEKWWQHKVETVLENETSKLLWDFNVQLQTDRAIQHYRPNIVLINKVDSKIKIKDIAVLWDANIESKYGEKVDHYKDLAIEHSRLWQKLVIYNLGCVKSNLFHYP